MTGSRVTFLETSHGWPYDNEQTRSSELQITAVDTDAFVNVGRLCIGWRSIHLSKQCMANAYRGYEDTIVYRVVNRNEYALEYRRSYGARIEGF